MLRGLCELTGEPDFKPIVDKSIAIFAVYTGATLLFFVRNFLFGLDQSTNGNSLTIPEHWKCWVTLAVSVLLLRYIIGSATHLNHYYVPAITQKIESNEIKSSGAPKSNNLCLLVFDLFFLIVFGVIAVFMTASMSIEDVMWAAIYFLLAGLTWSVLALARAGERSIAFKWVMLDSLQIAITLILIFLPVSILCKAIALGLSYLVFLFVDLRFMVQTMK